MAEEVEQIEPDLNAFQTDSDLPAKPVAIDIYKNSVGNPIKGSNPGLNTMSPKDFAASAVASDRGKQDDPYMSMRPFTYSADYDGANFDRYYGTKAYKALGFSPYRDNDALYNQKMTFGDQFVRAAGQWGNLMSTGFMSGVKTWGTIFTDPLAPDLDSARDMQRANAIGTSTAGGFGGAITNTFLNSAYSIGIGLEFLAEEAALAAATAFSGGLAGEATLPAMVARGGMLGKQLLKAGELGAKIAGKTDKFADAARGFEKVKDFTKVAAETAGGSTVGSARDYFSKFASGAFDVVNPFESTSTALKSTRYANDLAKTVGTVGAFADDIIRIKTAASEAKLEGGMVKIDATEKLIQQYRELHGKDPEGADLKKIEDLSSIEARRAVLWNFPAIMTTNNLLFSTILYPLKKVTGTASGKLLQNIVAEKGMKAAVTDPFSIISKTTGAQIKAAAKSLAKPKIYGSYGMAYLKANIGEGLQENFQEAISQGAIEHALAVQKDPGMSAYRGYMGYLMDGLKDQVSAEGAETFASGFIMGAFTQPIMTAPAWALSKGAEKFKSKESRDAAKATRDEAEKRDVAVLNDLATNDILYWGPNLITSIKNGKLSKDIMDDAQVGNVKGSKDNKFRLEFNHIETAVRTGKFEDLMTRLADYKNFTPAEALEAFQRYGIGINTEAEASAALDQIDGVIERARRIKDQYEKVAQEFPNPYTTSGINPNIKEFTAILDAQRAWTEAQNNLVFANSEFQEYSKRLEKMTATFGALASGIAKTDAQSLMAVTSLPNLNREIDLLNKEIQSLGELEGQAAIKKQKEKTRDLIQNFKENIVAAQEKIANENITDYFEKQQVYQGAKKEFQKYLTYLAKKNDTILFNSAADEAFTLLTDTLEMRDEQHRLADSINVLNNPKGFLTLQKRLADAFSEERLSRNDVIADNIKKFLTMVDENDFIQALGQAGVKIPEDFLAEYKEALTAGKALPTPTTFIDPSTQTEVTAISNPDKFAKAINIWEGFAEWMKLNHQLKDPEPVITPEEMLQNAAEDKKAIIAYNDYDQGLKDDLAAMYNKAKADKDIDETESLGTFLRTNPEALIQIKLADTAKKLNEEMAAKAAVKKDEGIPLGTAPSEEAKRRLNRLDYTNTQIKDLSKEERDRIIRDGIYAEDYYTIDEDPRIAAIERRKEDRIKKVESKFWIGNEKAYLAFLDELGGYELKTFKSDVEIISYLKNRIQTKYDAELATLGKEPITTTPVEIEVEEEPVKDIHEEYVGKIIYMTPGSNIKDAAKNNKNIIDVDSLIQELQLDSIRELKPDVIWDVELSFEENFKNATRYQQVNEKDVNNLVANKIREIALRGKTVLTSNMDFMKNSDYLMLLEYELIKDPSYNFMDEVFKATESNVKMIAVTTEAAETLKLSPIQLLGIPQETSTEETEINPVTIEDINQNRTINNLQIAQERGYDALYKNNRYTITKVDENSVTLKAMDGTTLEVKPEEITAITQTENVVTTLEENEVFKSNQKVDEGFFNFDFNSDDNDLDKAGDDIIKNIC